MGEPKLDLSSMSPMAEFPKRVCTRKNSLLTAATELTDKSGSESSCDKSASILYANASKNVMPYHVVVDQDFAIKSAGKNLLRIFDYTEEQLLGQRIENILQITKPSRGAWDWGWLFAQEELSFRVEPSDLVAPRLGRIRFLANVVHSNDIPLEAMINVTPDAQSTDDLLRMGLCPERDVTSHSAELEVLKLRQEIKVYKERALEAYKLRQTLEKERNLLENLVPRHVAEGMRKGENVAPRQHENVTFFFSDVKGFTDMCKQIYPWQVTGMLNRLYCVMDYLADKFKLFKVETVGDAWVGCCGLPEDDPNHAENVANFAIAVSRCTKHVLSPVDGTPIQLRIGVHTGPAASGVVGVKNPRYCVFGDTVNITARHESSGEAGRVHCSSVTRKALEESGALANFNCIERGLIDMKGKGELRTFWLEPNENNEFLNEDGMPQLEMEIDDLLCSTKFDNKMEKETAEKSIQLINQLGEASLSGMRQDFLAPILDIIKRDLSGKSIGCSQHGLASQHGGRRMSKCSRRSSNESLDSLSTNSSGAFSFNGSQSSLSVSQHSTRSKRGSFSRRHSSHSVKREFGKQYLEG